MPASSSLEIFYIQCAILNPSFAIVVYMGIMKLINKTRDKKVILVIVVASLFSVAGFLGTLHTAVIAFIPVVPLSPGI